MAQVEPEAHDRPGGAPSQDPKVSNSNPPVLAHGHSNGHNGSNGNGHDGNGTLNVEDPRTRLLLEQILNTLSQETTPAEDKKSQGFSIGHYVTVVRRRWRPMLFVMLVTAALIGWRLKPGAPSYTATATMQLPPNTSAAVSATDIVAIATGTRPSVTANVDTQIAIIQGPELIKAAVNRLKRKGWGNSINPGSVAVKASAPVSPDLIDITVSAGSGPLAIAMANELIKAFIDRSKLVGNQTFKKNLKFLEAKVVDIKSQLDQAKRRLQNYKERNKVFSVDQRLSEITAHIQELETEKQKADAEVASGPNSTTVLNDATTTALQQKATEAESKLSTTLREYLPQSPEAIKAKQEADSARALYNHRVGVMKSTVRSRAQEIGRELALARREASTLPAKEFQLTELMGEVELLSATYKTLSNNLTNMTLQSNAEVATASTLTPATYAAESIRTWRQAIILAALCGLVLAALTAFLLEQTDNTLHATDDLETLLPHTAVLGTMPFLKKKAERRLLPASGAGNTSPILLESCRIIRSNMAFASLEAPVRSVLVTSADPGEGKSLCALNLATVMAFDGRRVILLDCDLRRPVQHMLNELPLEPGVSNVLAGEATWESAVRATNVSNLWVIPAGTLPPNPPELLGSGQCRQLMQDLKENYDMVILDSPPVMSLTDAQVLCTIADGVAMVVGADSTTKPHVKRTQSMLRHAGGRLLGIILNKVQERNNADAYSTYYSYYGDGKQGARGAKGFLTRGS